MCMLSPYEALHRNGTANRTQMFSLRCSLAIIEEIVRLAAAAYLQPVALLMQERIYFVISQITVAAICCCYQLLQSNVAGARAIVQLSAAVRV